MKLRADLLMADDSYTQFTYARPDGLRVWGDFLQRYADAVESGSDATFEVTDGVKRLEGRFAGIDRLDLTWEA